jgi:hypothetical protein
MPNREGLDAEGRPLVGNAYKDWLESEQKFKKQSSENYVSALAGGYTPLSTQFGDVANFKENDTAFNTSMEDGVDPYEKLLGNSLFDLFNLSQMQDKPDYLGNLLANPDVPGIMRMGGMPKKYAIGGIGDVMPSQTEVYKGLKEQIALSDGSIFDVNAKTSHEKMDPSKVTDLLMAGSYIGAARDTYKISKTEAEDVSFGFATASYKEGKIGAPPEESLLSDLFNKKSMNSAELFKAIKKKYPTVDKRGDIFTNATNKENKSQRAPRISAVIDMIENKKTTERQSDPEQLAGIYEQLQHITPDLQPAAFYNVPQFKKGGSVPKYWLPYAVAGFNAITSIVGGISAGKAKRKNEKMINENFEESQSNLQLGTAAQLASTFAQDDSYSFLNLDRSRAEGNDGFNNAASIFKNSAATQQSRIGGQFNNLSNTLFNNTSSFGDGLTSALSLLPNTLRASSDVEANRAAQLANLGLDQATFNSGVSRDEAIDRQTGENYKTEFNNNRIGQTGDLIANHSTQQNNLIVDKTNALLSNEGKAVAAQQQMLNNISNTATQVYGLSKLGAEAQQVASTSGNTGNKYAPLDPAKATDPVPSINCIPGPIPGTFINKFSRQPC